MKVVKANLPEGVKKKFIVKLGKKVKLLNKKKYSRWSFFWLVCILTVPKLIKAVDNIEIVVKWSCANNHHK